MGSGRYFFWNHFISEEDLPQAGVFFNSFPKFIACYEGVIPRVVLFSLYFTLSLYSCVPCNLAFFIGKY